MENDVQFLRLKNGEDLITEVKELDSTYMLINPCKILYLKGNKLGYLSISLMQWVFTRICSEQLFEIEKSEVMFKTYPEETLIEHYWNSVQHFMNVETESKVEFESFEEDEDIAASSEEGLELLRKLLEGKNDKGNLH